MYAGPVCASESVWVCRSDAEDRHHQRDQQAQRADRDRPAELTTPRAQAVQAREARLSLRIRGQSTRGPMPPSRAGSRVSTTAVETSGINMPPMPMLRSSGTGITSSEHRLIATVPALASTACAGVLHRISDGLVVLAAVGPLLTPAVDQQQRVVDRHAEADQGDQELHDEADVEHVGADQHDAERGQDRHRRDHQRHQRQERGEQERQHGHRAQAPSRVSNMLSEATLAVVTTGPLLRLIVLLWRSTFPKRSCTCAAKWSTPSASIFLPNGLCSDCRAGCSLTAARRGAVAAGQASELVARLGVVGRLSAAARRWTQTRGRPRPATDRSVPGGPGPEKPAMDGGPPTSIDRNLAPDPGRGRRPGWCGGIAAAYAALPAGVPAGAPRFVVPALRWRWLR